MSFSIYLPEKTLTLEDLQGLPDAELRARICSDHNVLPASLERYEILIAYQSEGSWGCDSSNWFLLRLKGTKELFENHGSHCSCHGFEEQWSPEVTTLEYLKSDKFSFSTGGYDNCADANKQAAKDWILKNL